MRINQLFQKAFVGGQWYVAYREKGKDSSYNVIKTPEDMWIADPTMFESNGEHYLFVEVYEKKKKKAAIGYYQFENGTPKYKGLIIERPYHMSYPCVFSYENDFYMIPESSANNSVTLYKAIKFPSKWEKVKDLIVGDKYVDTTIVKHEGKILLLSYKANAKKWQLMVFNLDMKNNKLKKINTIIYEKNIGRPAGYVIKDKRPAQNCSNKYGENILVYEIESYIPYKEYIVDSIRVEDIKVDGNYDRVHTYTADTSYEVIDLYKEKIDLLHGIRIFKRAYLKK